MFFSKDVQTGAINGQGGSGTRWVTGLSGPLYSLPSVSIQQILLSNDQDQNSCFSELIILSASL